jgi:hypothetical protein
VRLVRTGAVDCIMGIAFINSIELAHEDVLQLNQKIILQLLCIV